MDVDRRSLVLGLGMAVGVGVGASVITRPHEDVDAQEPPPEPDVTAEPTVAHADEFGTVIDAVQVGADPRGEEPINGLLEEYADDDTLLSFPEGRYLLEPTTIREYNTFGIAGRGAGRPTFVAEAGTCVDGGSSYVHFQNVSEFLLHGVTFDFTASSTGGVVRITATGDATVTDVRAPGACAAQVALFRLDVTDASSTAVVDALDIENESTDSWLTGVYVGKQHAGDLVFRNCTVEGFTDNGLYASAPGLSDGAGGIVHVEGGTYRNNNVSNVRLGSAGSVARGVTAISDSPPPSDGDVTANARGFRLRSGHGQLIDDCEVYITGDSRFTHGGIVFHHTNGGATVRNTRVDIDRNETAAIRLFSRDNDNPAVPVFENVRVTGSAAGGQAVLVVGRDETIFRECRIEQSGADRHGIVFRDSADCRLVDSTIDVTSHPLVLRNATVSIENTTLITPDGSETIDEMEATAADFGPERER